jgi:adenylate cyclase
MIDRRTTDKIQSRADRSAPSAAEIRTQLEKIVSSPNFQNASRLREFLRFVVNEKLGGRVDNLKAYTIGLEVFDRPENFDPITDTIVRVNAGKLRRALERYYLGPGRQDKILISIPKGRYSPVFQIQEFEQTRGDVNSVQSACDPLDSTKLPTIAVLPFRKVNLEPSREFIINGFGEELTMALSRFSGLRVIAYYSTSGIKPEQYSQDQLRRRLGATFVITGSIYQTAGELRLNVELVRTDNFQQVWSQRYDRNFTVETLFSIEDDIIQNIVAAVADDYGIIPKIIATASRGKTVDELDAYEAVMRYHHFGITIDSQAYEEALQALEKSVVIDAEYALAWALLSILYFDAFTFSFAELKNPVERGTEAARKAIAIDPFCQHAYFGMCFAQLLQQNKEEVIRNAKKIIELNPNAGFLVGTAGWFLAMAGQYDEGFGFIEQSMQLNPLFPSWFHFPYYLNYYLRGDFSGALKTVEKFGLPDFFWNPLMQAAVLGQLRKINDAQAALQRLLSLKPDFPAKARFYINCFLIKDKWVDRMLEGLKKAGLKEV